MMKLMVIKNNETIVKKYKFISIRGGILESNYGLLVHDELVKIGSFNKLLNDIIEKYDRVGYELKFNIDSMKKKDYNKLSTLIFIASKKEKYEKSLKILLDTKEEFKKKKDDNKQNKKLSDKEKIRKFKELLELDKIDIIEVIKKIDMRELIKRINIEDVIKKELVD